MIREVFSHMSLSHSISFKLLSAFVLASFGILFFVATNTYAATLQNAKDIISTSRPSPSSPVAANATAGVGQITIFDNGSRFLASDSAKISIGSTGVISNHEFISSQSDDLETVYLTDTLGTYAGQGADVLYAPITAMHTVSFTTVTNIPAGGNIVITFPGSGNNSASPSATTFAFNGLTSANAAANISYKLNSGGTATCTSFTVSAPSITCVTTGADIVPGETVTFLIGCADAGTNTATCTTQAPRLINPTKVNLSGLDATANADVWEIGIETQDDGASTLDTSTVSIGTIESVTVRATVDPTLSFTITGINNATAVNTSNSGCSYNELTNTGVNSTAPNINLGILSNTPAIDASLGNIAAQRINISSNGPSGYALTATASSTLLNPQTGYFLTASTTPAAYIPEEPFFGLHACGQDVPSTYIETGAAGDDCESHADGSSATECHYAWPSANASMSTTPLAIASDASGPIGSGSPDAAGDGVISIAYGAGIDVAVPPGEYRAIITYIATPSF